MSGVDIADHSVYQFASGVKLVDPAGRGKGLGLAHIQVAGVGVLIYAIGILDALESALGIGREAAGRKSVAVVDNILVGKNLASLKKSESRMQSQNRF